MRVRIIKSLFIVSLGNQCPIVSHSGLKSTLFFFLIPFTSQSETLFSSEVLTIVVLTLAIRHDKGSMSIPITLCPAKIPSAKVVPEPQNGSKMVLLFCPAKYLLIAHLGICGMNLAGYL